MCKNKRLSPNIQAWLSELSSLMHQSIGFNRLSRTSSPARAGPVPPAPPAAFTSIALGALALGSFYLSQDIDLATGPQGETIAVYRPSTGKALIGGAIGVHKSMKTHAEYVEKLTQALQSQGILLGLQ